MAEIRGGSTSDGYEIVTKNDVPMIFRVYNDKLQYSVDEGTSWIDAEYTTDATATAAQILSGVTAYVNGTKVTGTLPIMGNEEYAGWRRADVSQASVDGRVHLRIPNGAYLGAGNGGLQGVFSDDAEFTAANIKTGIDMFGLVGTFTSDANAVASSISSGYTAYVKGAKVTGNFTNPYNARYWSQWNTPTNASGQATVTTSFSVVSIVVCWSSGGNYFQMQWNSWPFGWSPSAAMLYGPGSPAYYYTFYSDAFITSNGKTFTINHLPASTTVAVYIYG